MASPVVVYLPGLFGSTLVVGPPAFPFDLIIWVSPLSVFSGIVLQLQLAADGESPGPRTDGYPVVPTGHIDEYYGPLSRYLESKRYMVSKTAYDWRHTIARSASAVYQDLLLNLRGVPIVFVAHSMGGLVARAVAALMRAGGQGDQVLGIITLGCPHYGSLLPVQTWFGIGKFYGRLAQVIGLLFPSPLPYRNGMLDVIAATWPSLYELSSYKNSGPLFSSNPLAASQIYDIDNYTGGNPFLQAASMAAAIAAQDVLTASLDPTILRCIVGSGVRTPYDLLAGLPLNAPNVYLYNDDGDGVVPANSAAVPGSQVITVKGTPHELLPQDPQCWAAVRFFLQQILGPG
jgi:pimeloyl-ACP methyl ester carboxylesterase